VATLRFRVLYDAAAGIACTVTDGRGLTGTSTVAADALPGALPGLAGMRVYDASCSFRNFVVYQ
jgi:hypothetical protein